MNVRQQNRLIHAMALVFALAGAGVLTAALLLPAEIAAPEPASRHAAGDAALSPAAEGEAVAKVAIDELQQLAAIDLRRPLFDQASPISSPTAIQAPVPAASSLRLVGTVIEPGHSLAMFQKADGSIHLCAAGESIDDTSGKLMVTRIDGLKVTVQLAGQSRELILIRPETIGATP